MIRDITERIQAEEDKRQALVRMRQLSQGLMGAGRGRAAALAATCMTGPAPTWGRC